MTPTPPVGPGTLDALERLAGEATPGPWQARGQDDNATWIEAADGTEIGHLGYGPDTDLAAAAVNALPSLLAVVRAAEAVEMLAHPSSELPDRFIVHRDELAALRAALRALDDDTAEDRNG